MTNLKATKKALVSSVLALVMPKFVEMNKKAFALGYNA